MLDVIKLTDNPTTQRKPYNVFVIFDFNNQNYCYRPYQTGAGFAFQASTEPIKNNSLTSKPVAIDLVQKVL